MAIPRGKDFKLWIETPEGRFDQLSDWRDARREELINFARWDPKRIRVEPGNATRSDRK